MTGAEIMYYALLAICAISLLASKLPRESLGEKALICIFRLWRYDTSRERRVENIKNWSGIIAAISFFFFGLINAHFAGILFKH